MANCIYITKACAILHNYVGQLGEEVLLVEEEGEVQETEAEAVDIADVNEAEQQGIAIRRALCQYWELRR